MRYTGATGTEIMKFVWIIWVCIILWYKVFSEVSFDLTFNSVNGQVQINDRD